MQQAELSLLPERLQTDKHKHCRSLPAPFSGDAPSPAIGPSAEPTADLFG